MKLNIISFTNNGSILCLKLYNELTQLGYQVKSFALEKFAEKYGLIPLENGLSDWTRNAFYNVDGVIYIGACGIAVRSIAPFVQDKTKDPAIVVVDEAGQYAISLLSGHLGGANELAEVIADITGGIPVITTATDVNRRFAVDVFAMKNDLHIDNMTIAKQISAAILEQDTIGLYSEYIVTGDCPKGIVTGVGYKLGIAITLNKEVNPYETTLHLIPRIVTVGIGCKKGTDKDKIKELLTEVMKGNHLAEESVEQIASIDLKQEEPGIIELAGDYKVPFITFNAEELQKVQGTFTESEFVKGVTGVSNVCERSAVKACSILDTDIRIIQRKITRDGVTIALAVRDWSIHFE